MALSKSQQQQAEERMFGQRGAEMRGHGGMDDPEFPEVHDLPTEDSWVTFLGAGKGVFVSRYVNGGEPVMAGQTIFMDVSMCAVQLRSFWQDPRTNEYHPRWRLATDEEIAYVEAQKDTSNAGTANRSELARLAREGAVNSGQASFETEQAHAEEDAVKSTRKRRSRGSKES